MNGIAVLFCLLSVVAGILSVNFFPASLLFILTPFFIAFALFVATIVWRRFQPFKKFDSFYLVAVCMLFFGAGSFAAYMGKPAKSYYPGGNYIISGVVEDYIPVSGGDKAIIRLDYLALRTDDAVQTLIAENVKAQVTFHDISKIQYGSKINASATLRPYDTQINYVNTDYQQYLKRERILLTGWSDTILSVDDSRGIVPSINKWFRQLRDNLEIGIEKTSLSPSTKSFLITVLLGDKTFLSSEDRMLFTDAGVAHVFAVSGFHVSMISAFILGIMSLFMIRKLRKWKFLIAIPLIWFYVLLVGASPATLRAGIMLTIGLIALFLQRKNHVGRTLGWTVILILLFYPNALYNVGFQLSILCVGCLVFMAQQLNVFDRRNHPKLHYIAGIVLVSVCASLGCWMVCAFYFHKFSLIFLPLNVLAVPLLPLFVALALIYLILCAIGLDVSALRSILDLVYDGFHSFAEVLTGSSATISNLHPGWLPVALWLGGMVMLAIGLNSRKFRKLAWGSVPLLALAIVAIPFFKAPLPSGLVIQKNNQLFSMVSYKDGHEILHEFPKGESANVKIADKNIVILSTSTLSAELADKIKEADILLFGMYSHKIWEEVENLIREDCQIVLHPTLHWQYERKLTEKSKFCGQQPYSLRYDGPLHLLD